MVEDRAVREGLAEIVRPGVDMGIEMHEREAGCRAGRQRAQQRQGDAVLAAQAEQMRQPRGLRLRCAQAEAGMSPRAIAKVADIGERQRRRIDPGPGWAPSTSMRLARRIAAGPSRAPVRLVVPISSGMPATVKAAARSVRARPRNPAGVAKVGVPVIRLSCNLSWRHRDSARLCRICRAFLEQNCAGITANGHVDKIVRMNSAP